MPEHSNDHPARPSPLGGPPAFPAPGTPRAHDHPGDPSHPASAANQAATAIEIDEPAADLEAAMREALAAVEAVEADPSDPAAPLDRSHANEGDQQEVSSLRREITELRDRSVRTLADFDNFRKRAERERQDLRRYALLEPLRQFLPIADNLDRAVSAGGSAEDLKRGVELIRRQMQELLRRFGVREVAAAGEVFNPALHEAVARSESEAVAVPTVTEELVPGYMLHDRLLRPAMVKVALPPDKATEKPEQNAAAAPESVQPPPDGG